MCRRADGEGDFGVSTQNDGDGTLSGLFYKAPMEEMPQCYTGVFNAALAISPFTLPLFNYAL